MTTSERKPRIDKRASLRRDWHEDNVVSCNELLPGFDADERKEKIRSPKVRDALVVQRYETDVLLERCEESLRESMASVLNTVISNAEDGNMQAVKFLFDRFLPDPRDSRVKFDLRKIKNVKDATGAWHDVFAAMSQGNITLKEAHSICNLLKSYIDANGLREFSSELDGLDKLVKKSS